MSSVEIPNERIAEFCKRRHIRRLDLFGSVLREDFRPDSDIDVLVEFEPGLEPGLFQISEMEQELTKLLGREVDLVEREAVEQSENYIRRRHILTSLKPVYVAG
jgi:predicted nucleotidyltransferase